MKHKPAKNTLTLSIIIIIQLLYLLAGCAGSAQNKTTATQQRFTDISYWVKVFEDPERDKWQKPDVVVRAMNLKPGDVVADIGAGTGYFTRRFAVAVSPSGKALGLDIEESMVKYMKEDARKLGLKNYEAGIVAPDDPGLMDESVDVIFLCNTYHHIENRTQYFKNVAHSLKKGGRIVIVDFYKNSDFGPPRHHKLAKAVVLEEMMKAGYELSKDLKILPHQYYLEFIK